MEGLKQSLAATLGLLHIRLSALLVRSNPLRMPSPILSNELRAVGKILLWFPSVVGFIIADPLDQVLSLEDGRARPVLLTACLHFLVCKDSLGLPLILIIHYLRWRWWTNAARFVGLEQGGVEHWMNLQAGWQVQFVRNWVNLLQDLERSYPPG
jgi:hypothetical protein